MVESLQNITKHHDKLDENSMNNPGFFIIQRMGSDYFITSGNVVENKNIESLISKLEKVNSLDKDRLKTYSKEILTEGEMSEKGGAGLGLIEMARRSGNKLVFEFNTINDKVSYFYLQTKIPSGLDSTNSNEVPGSNLETAKNCHNLLLERSIQLVYQGEFTQENVKSILSITEGDVGTSDNYLIKTRVFNIVVEMLQNIYKHALHPSQNKEAKSGIFLIGSGDKGYTLTAGNLILNNKIEEFKDKLDHVNSLNIDELENLYDKIIKQDDIPPIVSPIASGQAGQAGQNGAGLGLIDMKMKSKNALTYNFKPVNDEYSFFFIQCRVLH